LPKRAERAKRACSISRSATEIAATLSSGNENDLARGTQRNTERQNAQRIHLILSRLRSADFCDGQAIERARRLFEANG
jgi:hypothetical protein